MSLSTIAIEGITLSMEQLDDMRHAIGYEPTDLRKGQRGYTAQRNYFTCPHANGDWEDLVSRGLASASTFGTGVCYRLTDDGFAVLSYVHRVEIKEGR